MKITLTQDDMEEAVRDWVLSQIKVNDDCVMQVTFDAAGLKRNVFTTAVDIVRMRSNNPTEALPTEAQPEVETMSQVIGVEGVASTAAMSSSEPAATAVDDLPVDLPQPENETGPAAVPMPRTNPFSVALTGKVTDVDAGTEETSTDALQETGAQAETDANTANSDAPAPARSSLFRGLKRPVN